MLFSRVLLGIHRAEIGVLPLISSASEAAPPRPQAPRAVAGRGAAVPDVVVVGHDHCGAANLCSRCGSVDKKRCPTGILHSLASHVYLLHTLVAAKLK